MGVTFVVTNIVAQNSFGTPYAEPLALFSLKDFKQELLPNLRFFRKNQAVIQGNRRNCTINKKKIYIIDSFFIFKDAFNHKLYPLGSYMIIAASINAMAPPIKSNLSAIMLSTFQLHNIEKIINIPP